MARYKVDFTVEAAQLKSAEKLLQKLLGPSSKEIDWKVEKVKTPSNRAERLEEAAAMVSDALAIVWKNSRTKWQRGATPYPRTYKVATNAAPWTKRVQHWRRFKVTWSSVSGVLSFPG